MNANTVRKELRELGKLTLAGDIIRHSDAIARKKKELEERYIPAMNILDGVEQIVLTAKYFEGIPYEEIAKSLNYAIQTVQKISSNAVQKVADTL